MPFGTISQTGPRMKQVVGFGDQFMGRGNFGANLGRAIVTNGGGALRRTYATVLQYGPLPKLLCADLFIPSHCVT